MNRGDMCPTIVLRGREPILAVGAAGGPTIISQTLLAVLQVIDLGRTPAEALAQPRLHHQWKPDELVLESGWGTDVVTALRASGHTVREVGRPRRGAGRGAGVGRVGGGCGPQASRLGRRLAWPVN